MRSLRMRFDLRNTNLLATSSVEMVMIGCCCSLERKEKDTPTLALHTPPATHAVPVSRSHDPWPVCACADRWPVSVKRGMANYYALLNREPEGSTNDSELRKRKLPNREVRTAKCRIANREVRTANREVRTVNRERETRSTNDGKVRSAKAKPRTANEKREAQMTAKCEVRTTKTRTAKPRSAKYKQRNACTSRPRYLTHKEVGRPSDIRRWGGTGDLAGWGGIHR